MSDQAEVQSPEERLEALLGEEFGEDAVEPTDEDGQPSESDEVEIEEDEEDSQEETEAPQTIRLKRGDEEMDVGIEEVKNLAQMGYDYTKKTQEVAEQRKQVENYAQAIKAQEQNLQAQAQMQQAFIKEIAKVEGLNDQLAQYEKVDWGALSDSDPVAAQKHWIAYTQLQNKRTQAQNEIQQKSNYLQQQQATQNEARLTEAKAELLKMFPDWNATRAQELREAGKQYGFSEQELSGVTDPRTIKLLADAAAFRKLQANKVNVTNKVTGKPAVVKPGAKDGNAASKSQNAKMREGLRKSGRYQDAAALIERML